MHAYLAEVRDQYEDYPYPHRNPADEAHRLLNTFVDPLELINFHCFEGKENFRNHFRVLVAGGGTGDGTLYLADQLKDTNAEIIHLDISKNSIAIAQERCKIRGLKNVTFIHDSLLNVEKLGLGTFDYINCSGVLHHLASPSEGLYALKSVLKESGAMAIMLYAPHGRTGIYMVQQLMRLLAGDIIDKQQKIDLTKKLTASFHPSHIFSLLKHVVDQEIATEKDAGIYDLFLHSQDKPFTVPEIYALLDEQHMHLLEFLFVGGIGKSIYNPLTYVQDEEIRRHIAPKPARERHALAELLTGNLTMHSFFAAKTPRRKPSPQDMSMIPVYNRLMGNNFGKDIAQAVRNAPDSIVTLQHRGTITTTVTLPSIPYAGDILSRIDGKTSIADICHAVAAIRSAKKNAVTESWIKIYDALNLHDWLLLKAA